MTITATCHCGGTQIELPDAPVGATQCTCTYCTKSGGLWSYYPPAAPRIVRDDFGAVYSASDGINQHHFCTRCGCQTYGVSPDWSAADIGGDGTLPAGTKFALNARLLDAFEVIRGLEVSEIDGRNLW